MMLISDLFENYRFITRTRHGDMSADDLMDDVSSAKTLYKIGTANRYSEEQVLVVSGFFVVDDDYLLCLLDGKAKIHENR